MGEPGLALLALAAPAGGACPTMNLCTVGATGASCTLGLHSNYGGGSKDYLSWSLLGC
jgi:hypothetical protein